ncbi:MAG TPA: uracil-DNA glycosylase [Candidatus Saccharimonadales bacterium]|nr:uracil-DNA glycosylase [Candidatus Saccharimonadales bacterium]
MGKNQRKNANSKLLDQIRAEITEKNICPDLAKEATNLVMGVGNDNADIMFIGEAPGKNEDLKGEPFVGAAGKFLDEMLSQIGLSRTQIYITNIVKYRPPNNRDPLPEEKKAFWPYLLRQIMIIQPKVIVTLGRHSMEYFLPNMKISVIHGQPKRIRFQLRRSGGQREDGVLGADELALVILPLYHPAAALYNGSMRKTLIEDFHLIPKVVELVNNNQ